MALFFVTALRQSPQKHEDSAVPKVVAVDSLTVIKAISLVETNGSLHMDLKTRKERYVSNLKIAEKLGEYLLQTDFNNAASSPFNNGTKQSLAACGSTAQGASGTPVTAYFNTVTAATASSMIMVKLPNASAVGKLNQALVIFNSASTAITVIPAASESLDSGTAGSTSVSAGSFKHFYCSTSTKWVTCKGPAY